MTKVVETTLSCGGGNGFRRRFELTTMASNVDLNSNDIDLDFRRRRSRSEPFRRKGFQIEGDRDNSTVVVSIVPM